VFSKIDLFNGTRGEEMDSPCQKYAAKSGAAEQVWQIRQVLDQRFNIYF